MRIRDGLPGMMLGVLVLGATLHGRMVPPNDEPVLVRLGQTGLSGLDASALGGIALVDLPADGFAVLRGDTALIRSVFGTAVLWRGVLACSAEPAARS